METRDVDLAEAKAAMLFDELICAGVDLFVASFQLLRRGRCIGRHHRESAHRMAKALNALREHYGDDEFRVIFPNGAGSLMSVMDDLTDFMRR